MARQTQKKLLVHFYDDEQGDICLEWLDQQANMGDSIRQLIVQAVSGTGPSTDSSDVDELRRRIERLEDQLNKLLANMPGSRYEMAEMKKSASDFGTKPPIIVEHDTSAESDGSSADNLLHSLNNF